MTARRAATGAVVLAVLALAVLGLLRAASPVGAPTMRERVDAVAATLRCPTCQGLSIEDSTSVLADGSRRVIERQLEEGRTPDQVRQWFVDRYGPSVLLSPDPAGAGLLAWVAPAVIVASAGVLGWRWLRREGTPGGLDEASAALAAWREGALDPDDSPAGEALREALVAAGTASHTEASDTGASDTGASAAEGPDEEALARVAAAHRRYAARPAAAGPAGAAGPGPRQLPRRAVTVAAASALLVTVGLGAAVAVDGGPSGRGAGAAPAETAAAPSPGTGAASAPAGWTGGMPRTAEDWVGLGRAYYQAGQPDQAVAAYDAALRLQPDADAVVLMRADVLVRSGHADRALPDLQGLAARHPDTPDVLLVLGLAQNRTASPDASATLRRFLQLDPASPAAPGVRKLLGSG